MSSHPHAELLRGRSIGDIRWRLGGAIIIGLVRCDSGGGVAAMMDELLDQNLHGASPMDASTAAAAAARHRPRQRDSGSADIQEWLEDERDASHARSLEGVRHGRAPGAGHDGDLHEASVFEEQRFDSPVPGLLHEPSASASASDEEGGPQMVLAPRDDLIVHADDILIVIAEDAAEAQMVDMAECQSPLPCGMNAMAPPLGDDDEPSYLQEGAAAAVRAAESLSRGVSQNVQWGIDAAAGHMNIPHRKRGVPRAADPTKASSKAARDSTASKPTPPRGTATPGPPLAEVGRPKPSPLRSPPLSPPAAAVLAAAESPGTRSNLRQSSSRWSSDAGPSLSPGEYQSPSSDARATASAEMPTKQQVVLLVGWTPMIGSLLRALDARMPPGSTLFVLSERKEKSRAQEMREEGMAKDGSALSQGLDGYWDEGQASASRGGTKGAAGVGEDEVHLDPAAEGRTGLRGRPSKSKLASQTGVADGSGLRNVRVAHLEGHTTDILALQRLPIARADVAFIVADVGSASEMGSASGGGSELQIADSDAMTSTILLRQLREELSVPAELHVVTQMSDVLTRRLIDQQPNLLDAMCGADAEAEVPGVGGSSLLVFHRNYLETTALSVATHSHLIWSTLRMILYPIGGGDVRLVPASACMRVDERSPFPASSNVPLSFWDLAERVSQLNLGVLIGWRRAHRQPPGRGAPARHHSTSGDLGHLAAELTIGGLKSVGSLLGGHQNVGAIASRQRERGSKSKMELELNPPDKGRRLLWCDKDELLVLASQESPAKRQAGSGSSRVGLKDPPPAVPPPVPPPVPPLEPLEA